MILFQFLGKADGLFEVEQPPLSSLLVLASI